MISSISCEYIPQPFLEDLIVNFELRAPTVLIGEYVPEFCMTLQWVLCLKNTNNDETNIAQHLATLHLSSKQDAVIFAEGEEITTLVMAVWQQIPSLFRSSRPVFMPHDYAHLIDLRLDSNTLFYKRERDFDYTLFDKFTVKSGTPITKVLGSWNYNSGLEIYASKFRWKRRTDLKGAVVNEGLDFYKNYAHPYYDSHGNIISSEGKHPDRLRTVAEALNLNIKSFPVPDGEFGKQYDNGTWSGCVGMLTRNHADVCTKGLAYTLQRYTAIDYSEDLQMPRGGYTLIGASEREMILDMWAYVNVFGWSQWSIFGGLLLTIILVFIMISYNIDTADNTLLESASSGFSIVYLFVIQNGHHPEGGSNAKQMVLLTTALLAFLMFCYYTTDITAQMTSKRPPKTIQSFADVQQNKEIKIIVVRGTSWVYNFKSSEPGTPKNEVYKNRVESNEQVWYPSITDALNALMISDSNTYLFGYDGVSKTKPGLSALNMLDKTTVSVGLGIQKNSELVDIVRYQMLKLCEIGIITHIDNKWPDTSRNQDFTMAEPGPLAFNNVLFPFTLLATGIFTSMGFALLEFFYRKISFEARGQTGMGW